MKALVLLLLASPVSAQSIFIDTASPQYELNPSLADSLAETAREISYQIGLSDWRIYLHYKNLDSAGVDVLASTSATPEYRVAHIYIDLPDFERLVLQSRIEALRHEMIHVALWEYVSFIQLFTPEDLWELLINITERVTTGLTRMPLWKRSSPQN